MKLNQGNRKIKPPTVRTAAIYAVYITVLIHLFFLIMLVYGRSAVMPFRGDHHPHPQLTEGMFLFGLVSTYIYVFLLFCINFHTLKREGIPNKTKTVVAVLVSLLFIFLWNRFLFFIQNTLLDLPMPDPRALRGRIVRDITLGGLAVFSSLLVYQSYRRQLIILENEALKAEYERARYEALKNQIDPHFLFNTLNTLNAIIGNDPKLAQKYVQKLSSIFRYTIQSHDTATLGEELEFTRNYCDLMQIRYGDNLKFVFDIAGKYYSYSVAPFSLQTLVENAIKHNTITTRQPLTVTIVTDSDDSVTVSNPIRLKKEHETGEGIGLANLSERYKLKWDEEVVIRDDGAIFSVRLPLIAEEQM